MRRRTKACFAVAATSAEFAHLDWCWVLQVGRHGRRWARAATRCLFVHKPTQARTFETTFLGHCSLRFCGSCWCTAPFFFKHHGLCHVDGFSLRKEEKQPPREHERVGGQANKHVCRRACQTKTHGENGHEERRRAHILGMTIPSKRTSWQSLTVPKKRRRDDRRS